MTNYSEHEREIALQAISPEMRETAARNLDKWLESVQALREALLAYRRSHQATVPYADCTCALCRAADLALGGER